MKKILRLFLVSLLTISLSFSLADIALARSKGSYVGYKSYNSYHSPSLKTYKSPSLKIYKPQSLKIYSPKSPKLPSLKTYSPKSNKIYSPKVYYKNTYSNKPERSSAKKREFLKSRGYKETPSGNEVDHIIPLSKGGADEPYNMQLLPKEIHKQKTKTEQGNNGGYLFRK